MTIETYISIITLNVNRLNASTKRDRLAEWIQRQDPYMYAVYKKPICLTADLSAETLQARREWKDIFKVLKGKNL